MSQRKRIEVWGTNQGLKSPPLKSTSTRDRLVLDVQKKLFEAFFVNGGRRAAGLRPCKHRLCLYCWQCLERVGGEDMLCRSIPLFSLSISLFLWIWFSIKCWKVTAFLPGRKRNMFRNLKILQDGKTALCPVQRENHITYKICTRTLGKYDSAYCNYKWIVQLPAKFMCLAWLADFGSFFYVPSNKNCLLHFFSCLASLIQPKDFPVLILCHRHLSDFKEIAYYICNFSSHIPRPGSAIDIFQSLSFFLFFIGSFYNIILIPPT